MSLAKSREPRANAGSRMHRLLADEQEDDFYKTTYGGFNEESGDEEYSSEESGGETSSDSDIDAPEDDEPISDSDDEGPKRKRRVVTKAYKEPPKKPAPKKSIISPTAKEKKEQSTTPRSSSRRHETTERKGNSESVRKSTRRSTVQRVNEFEMRIKERETKARIMKSQQARKNVPEMRRLTQEELLAEAKITEKKNLHSLFLFQQLEEEKKKTKVFKKGFTGPYIRFHSMTMPLVPKIQEVDDVNVDKIDKPESGLSSPEAKLRGKSTSKCCRNFLTFSDPQQYQQQFPKGRKRPPPKQLCPITRHPARYIDPVTGIPFATKQAFKIIRETYATEIEAAKSSEPRRRSKSSVASVES